MGGRQGNGCLLDGMTKNISADCTATEIMKQRNSAEVDGTGMS